MHTQHDNRDNGDHVLSAIVPIVVTMKTPGIQ